MTDDKSRVQCFSAYRVEAVRQGFLTGGKSPPWGKYWEFRGEMRAFENCCLFKTGGTKWFPKFTFDEYILVIQILCLSTVDLQS